MDKSMLNLLFNYKGTISHREFRVGITILFLLVIIDFILLSVWQSTNSAIAAMGVEQISSIFEYNNIAAPFIPLLVPSQFIFTYTSFVLSLKRMRALSLKRNIAVLSGVSNYLFFASTTSLLLHLKMNVFNDTKMYQQDMLYVTPTVITIIVVFFVVGLLNLIVCAKAGGNVNTIPVTRGRLDPYGYVIQLGNVMGFATAFFILFTGLIIISPALLKYPMLITIISRIAILITLIFFITYTIRRLKDAGVRISLFITIAGVYIALIVFRYWMISAQHPMLYAFSSLFSAATNLLIAAQFLLFLLPSKSNEQTS